MTKWALALLLLAVGGCATAKAPAPATTQLISETVPDDLGMTGIDWQGCRRGRSIRPSASTSLCCCIWGRLVPLVSCDGACDISRSGVVALINAHYVRDPC